jgi:hypothetical protein
MAEVVVRVIVRAGRTQLRQGLGSMALKLTAKSGAELMGGKKKSDLLRSPCPKPLNDRLLLMEIVTR